MPAGLDSNPDQGSDEDPWIAESDVAAGYFVALATSGRSERLENLVRVTHRRPWSPSGDAI
jgi:hypothetical protein